MKIMDFFDFFELWNGIPFFILCIVLGSTMFLITKYITNKNNKKYDDE